MLDQEVKHGSVACAGKGHPDVTTATVTDVIRKARQIGDKGVMSTCLGTFEIVSERGKERGFPNTVTY